MSTRPVRPRAWQSFTAETCELDGAPAMRFSGPAPSVILPAEAVEKLVVQLYGWLVETYPCPDERHGGHVFEDYGYCALCEGRGYLVPK